MKVFGTTLISILVIVSIMVSVTFCETVDRLDWNVKYNSCSGDTSIVAKSEFVNDKYVSCGPCCEIASFPRSRFNFSFSEEGYPLKFTLPDGTNIGTNFQLTLRVPTQADALKCMNVVSSKSDRGFDSYCAFNLPQHVNNCLAIVASKYRSCESLYSDQVGFKDSLANVLFPLLRKDGVEVATIAYKPGEEGPFQFPEAVRKVIRGTAESKAELVRLTTNYQAEEQRAINEANTSLLKARADSARNVTTASGEYQAAKYRAMANKELSNSITPQLIQYEKARRYNSTTKMVTPNGQVLEIDRLNDNNN